jgi:hypothetical protein
VFESLTLVDPRTGQLLWRGFADPGTADGQGAITNRIAAPRLARRRDRRAAAFSSFTDQADPENKVAFVQWILSDWSIRIRAWARGNGRARGAMVIDTYGWTSEGPSLYAHYYRGPCPDQRREDGGARGAMRRPPEAGEAIPIPWRAPRPMDRVLQRYSQAQPAERRLLLLLQAARAAVGA